MRNSCLDSPFFSGEMEGKLSLCSPVFYTALPSDILKAVKKLRNKKVLFTELSTSHSVESQSWTMQAFHIYHIPTHGIRSMIESSIQG